jgi:hypothetical protein
MIAPLQKQVAIKTTPDAKRERGRPYDDARSPIPALRSGRRAESPRQAPASAAALRAPKQAPKPQKNRALERSCGR